MDGFFRFPDDVTFWTLINSPLFVAVVGGSIGVWFTTILQRLGKEIKNDREATDMAKRFEEAAAATEEELSTSSAEKSDPERIAALKHVNEIRTLLDKIANKDPDGRYKKTYAKIHRGNLRALLAALEERGRVDRDLYAVVKSALDAWSPYSRGPATRRDVPPLVPHSLNNAVKALQRHLP